VGAVAMGYFFAAAFALAVACCGRDPRAKLCAAYLICSWLASNQIFQHSDPTQALDRFSYLDVTALYILFVVLVRWPSRWLTLLVSALLAQVALQAYYAFLDPEARNDYTAFLANNLLYIVQLVAVTIPTFFRARRRRVIRRGRKSQIAPPYPNWVAPEGYRREWSDFRFPAASAGPILDEHGQAGYGVANDKGDEDGGDVHERQDSRPS
jgi:hypothetical protein